MQFQHTHFKYSFNTHISIQNLQNKKQGNLAEICCEKNNNNNFDESLFTIYINAIDAVFTSREKSGLPKIGKSLFLLEVLEDLSESIMYDSETINLNDENAKKHNENINSMIKFRNENVKKLLDKHGDYLRGDIRGNSISTARELVDKMNLENNDNNDSFSSNMADIKENYENFENSNVVYDDEKNLRYGKINFHNLKEFPLEHRDENEKLLPMNCMEIDCDGFVIEYDERS